MVKRRQMTVMKLPGENLLDGLRSGRGLPTLRARDPTRSLPLDPPFCEATPEDVVGTAALQWFARPVCCQGFPQEALPPELRDQTEMGLWRLVGEEFTREHCSGEA
jgi:hypothetical protein